MKKLYLAMVLICLSLCLTGCGITESTAVQFSEDVSLMVAKSDVDILLKTYSNFLSEEVISKLAKQKDVLDDNVNARLEEFSSVVVQPDEEDDFDYRVVYYGYRLKNTGNSSWVMTTVDVDGGKIEDYNTEVLYQNQLRLGA